MRLFTNPTNAPPGNEINLLALIAIFVMACCWLVYAAIARGPR